MFNYITNLFCNSDAVPNISWQSIFEGTRRLLGLILQVPLIVSLRLNTEIGLAAVNFSRIVFRQSRKSGLLHTALYFKQCSTSLQRYYAGCYCKSDSLSCVVGLTRSGIPTVIPKYIRKIIRRRDDRADTWVRIYLSWFTIARMIELAPKVSSRLFKSITEPCKDIESAIEVTSMIKTHGPNLISKYLPGIRSIPLLQGLKWEPTWKSVPLSTKFVSRYRSIDSKESETLDQSNIFSNLKHEMAGFIFNINKIHSIQDGFFSPGCLWPEWIIYPLDHKRTSEIMNWSLEWFERRIGPHMSTILPAYQLHPPVPLFTGKLAQTLPGAGKRRIFAVCNYIKQRLLKPTHNWAMEVLSTIPMDGTFYQEGPLIKLAKLKPNECYSFDLSSATDRWPLTVIYTVFMLFFGPTCASAVVNSTLGLNTFRVDKPITRKMYEVSFLCGQPLGYYGSWSLFALSHHFVVWLAAELAYPDTKRPFTRYAVLGDDVLIADKQVALEYRGLLDKLSVSISDSKSIVSDTGCIEFAKKFWVKRMQKDLSPVSLKSLLSSRTSLGICQLAAKYKVPLRILFRLAGAGYRVRSRMMTTLSRKWERLKSIRGKLTHQEGQLPLDFWIGRGLPLNPYLKGKIIDFLRKEFKPKEIRIPPEGLLFDGEVEICERTVLRGWMEQWLKWNRWYYLVALSDSITIEDLMAAPICATMWYRKLVNPITKFSAIWKCYDMAASWPYYEVNNFIIGPDTVITHPRWILGGKSGTDFLMAPLD